MAPEQAAIRDNRCKDHKLDPFCADIFEKEIGDLESIFTGNGLKSNKWGLFNFIYRMIQKVLSLFGLSSSDFHHDDITIKVYRRLRLRHAILHSVEQQSNCHCVNGELKRLFCEGILSPQSLQTFSAHGYLANKQYSNLNSLNMPLWRVGSKQSRISINSGKVTIEEPGVTEYPQTPEEKKPFSFLPPKLRAYNLAVTDLFVEKALAYLNRKAKTYNMFGFVLMCISLFAVAAGIDTSSAYLPDNTDGRGIFSNLISETKDSINDSIMLLLKKMNLVTGADAQPKPTEAQPKPTEAQTEVRKSDPNGISENEIHLYNTLLEKILQTSEKSKDPLFTSVDMIKFIREDKSNHRIMAIMTSFVKGFTFYGLLILLSVFSYRMAKALFDQAERLKDRRHALRQGRLFVHLNGGILTIDDLERAFNWNVSQENAFANIDPDAQAPWGVVVKELVRAINETSKAGIKAAGRIKSNE